MAYVDDFKIPGSNSVTWNNVVYWPVTEWTTSSVYASGQQNTRAAVRFLMAATSSIDNNIIIAQYSAYTPDGKMYGTGGTGRVASGYYLMRRLNSEPGDLSQAGTINQGTIVSTPDIDIRLWPWNTTNDHTVQEGHLIWPDRPYIFRSVGTLASGASGTCMRFYIKDTDPAYRNTMPNIVATYTAPYKVIYNANGGSGSVDPVAKNGGDTITLPSSAFTRANYNLLGFSTNQSSLTPDTGCTPGATYTVSSNVTLYAIWSLAQSYITYDKNQPSGSTGTISGLPSPNPQIKQPGVNATISSALTSNLDPPYTFTHWNTSTDDTGTTFEPGATYSKDINMTLYAIWRDNYSGKESKFEGTPSVYRAKKSGSTYTKDDYGEYLVISGKVRIYDISGLTNIPKSLTSMWSPSTESVVSDLGENDFTLDQTATGYKIYSFEYKSANVTLDSGKAYNYTLRFKDTYQTTYSNAAKTQISDVIPVAFITFSTNAKGKSAAFGGEAVAAVSGSDASGTGGGPGRLDVNMNTYFNNSVKFNGAVNGIPVDGTTIGYNGNGQLSYVGTFPSTLTCTMNNGYIDDPGAISWDYCRGFNGSGFGWREEKWSDGRLTLYEWCWWTLSTSPRIVTCKWPTAATQFISTPTWSFGSEAPDVNGLDISIQSLSIPTSFNLRLLRTGGSTTSKAAICVRFDGRWQ